MLKNNAILVAKGKEELYLLPAMANRHGLVAGATGTGKTVTLQTMAESFSRLGVPVFLADVKGDLSGVSVPAGDNPKVKERLKAMAIKDYRPAGCPVVFWDVFGELGHPVRTTVSEMGPLLLGRLLNLNETQEGVLSLVFKLADDEGLLLLDLKDLRAMLQYAGDHAAEFTTEYGKVSTASVGAIQRALLALEEQGADRLFGEPALNLDDFMQAEGGSGVINILASEKLINSPKVYATFLLWLLSELFEELPEAGDREKPKLVFFFDEAHLLFDDAPKALVEKIEQVVRLIRSKGVGVYFVTQNPLDIPEKILGQLGNRVQHALRAFTPKDQKAVKSAAETFRTNPKLDVESAITELGVGEALVSFLDGKGTPSVVERAYVCPPESNIGPVSADERAQTIKASAMRGRYEKAVDRESAFEILKGRAGKAVEATEKKRAEKPAAERPAPAGRQRESMAEAMMKSAARAIGSQVGRQLIRGVLGSLMRK